MKWILHFQEMSRRKFQSHHWYDWCQNTSIILYIINCDARFAYILFYWWHWFIVFFINPWIWKCQNRAKDSIFRGRSIENSLEYFLRWNSRCCWLLKFKCLYFDTGFYNYQDMYATDLPKSVSWKRTTFDILFACWAYELGILLLFDHTHTRKD